MARYTNAKILKSDIERSCAENCTG